MHTMYLDQTHTSFPPLTFPGPIPCFPTLSQLPLLSNSNVKPITYYLPVLWFVDNGSHLSMFWPL